MSEWKEVRLAEVCAEVRYGATASASKKGDSKGPQLLRVTDIVPPRLEWESVPRCDLPADKVERFRLRDGDIVVARSGSVGYAKYVRRPPSNAVFASYLVRFRVGDQADPEFVGHVVQSKGYREWVQAHATGAAQPNANAKVLGGFPLLLPDLPTQRRISALLSAFDELIEINERRIELLEDLARSLYREWFVHFRFPGRDQVALVDSELGTIPEGWEVTKLGSVATLVMGQSPKSEFYNDDGDGLPFHQGVTRYGALIPTHEKYCTVSPRIAEQSDVLCSVRAPVGRLNLADVPMVIGRGLSAVRRNDGLQAFLMPQLRQALGREDSIGAGTIYKAITKTQLAGLPVLEPPRELRDRYQSIAGPMLDQRLGLTYLNRQARKTQDLLLPRLVTGRLDISEVDLGVLTPAEAE